MLTKLNEIRLVIVEFLNIILFKNEFIVFNYWSIAHVIFGVIVMLLIFKFSRKSNEKLWILFFVLVLWEIFEMAFWMNGSTFFRQEPIIDITWDLILGFVGGLIVYKKNDGK